MMGRWTAEQVKSNAVNENKKGEEEHGEVSLGWGRVCSAPARGVNGGDLMLQGLDLSLQDFARPGGPGDGESLPLHGKQALQRFKQDGGCHAYFDGGGTQMFTRFDNIVTAPIVPACQNGAAPVSAGFRGRCGRRERVPRCWGRSFSDRAGDRRGGSRSSREFADSAPCPRRPARWWSGRH